MLFSRYSSFRSQVTHRGRLWATSVHTWPLVLPLVWVNTTSSKKKWQAAGRCFATVGDQHDFRNWGKLDWIYDILQNVVKGPSRRKCFFYQVSGTRDLGPAAKLPAGIRPGLFWDGNEVPRGSAEAHFSLAPTTLNKVCLSDENFKLLAF